MQIVIGLITIFVLFIGITLFKYLKENTGPPPKTLKDIFGFIMYNKITILLVILFIFGSIVISSIFDKNLNTDNDTENDTENDTDKDVKTYETMNNITNSFCQSHSSSQSLDKSCSELSKTNCNSVGCCVFLNNEKCVAGNKNGPTYLGSPDNLVKIDNYYYKNKCYGNC